MALPDSVASFIEAIGGMELDDRVSAINEMREAIHSVSPFASEPVDLVQWVKVDDVRANDYNPNTVAPPEMELLRRSIDHDGYTQPVVTWKSDDGREVVDGFHRTRVCKECDSVRNRVLGYLPVVTIRSDCQERNDRVASTIRHNRARGKHKIDSMSDIVIELKNRNWSDSRISKELGMDEDEILRLCQITGLADLFKDEDFSRAWEIDDSEPEFEPLTEEFDVQEKEENGFRTVNTSDPDRVFHTFEKWECHKAGFYNTSKPGLKKEHAEALYAAFLADDTKFRHALERVIREWKHSCEHYLTNKAMNRIAWLGQASACISEELPACYCGGFNLLSKHQQDKANNTALEYLNKWLIANNREPVDLDSALTGRQSTIY